MDVHALGEAAGCVVSRLGSETAGQSGRLLTSVGKVAPLGHSWMIIKWVRGVPLWVCCSSGSIVNK